MEKQFEDFLEKLIVSINDGYLPEDWQDKIRPQWNEYLYITSSDYYILHDDCVWTEEGDLWHNERDQDEYGFDEYHEVYRNQGNLIYAYGHRGHEYSYYREEVIYVRGSYYHTDYLSHNYIVEMYNGEYEHSDDAYYWESDREYHYDPEPDDDEDDEEDDRDNRKLWDYNSGPRELSYLDDDRCGEGVQFGFGIEIEKSQMPDFDFDKREIYEKTGAVLERDGSVSYGFELKTPIYNLMSPMTDERIKPLKPFCDINGVENAGGHVGFSMSGKRDEELLDLCSGWLPLIFAMYKKRLSNHYCAGRNIEGLKKSGDKFQAVRMRGNYIEFRLFSSVKSFETLKFRIALFRIIAQNLGKSFNYIMTMAISEGTELNKLLRGDVYSDADKFCRLMSNAIQMNKEFIGKRITNKSLDKIHNQLLTIKSN